ncbi:hypothetical protein CROQUDRAFT_108385 [Cronartium quercuum f. sp. fusiforme G11]|uniref:Uncharacterized protein n=1 Tax=Cronartium quercuum f. sp. fusiforme G11 TaxID=708437 RepID=A0A9P6TAI9_9BASI|nr:hypothetical protein CROQUDRAFT_108385 [Cronartium quercuum f. sp. fusiforme G11]
MSRAFSALGYFISAPCTEKVQLKNLTPTDSDSASVRPSTKNASPKNPRHRYLQQNWITFRRFTSPYLRLARLHTIMAWAIFPAPALYTAILFHATQLPDMTPLTKMVKCLRICAALFVSVMSYRAAGLAWDDLIDREYDAKVTRSKIRPLPAGELTGKKLDGAVFCIALLSGLTIILLQVLLAPEVFPSFFFSGAIFLVYPFLKRVTYYTQFFGAWLISMGVIQAWVACAAIHDPVPGAGSGWGHVVAIIYRDAIKLGPIFLMEFLYELAHELIYGCQDTGEDMEIGLFSLSILCGYKLSRLIGFILVSCFAGLVGYCAAVASLPAWPLTVLPVFWLMFNFVSLDLAIPKSCGTWATQAIKV